MSGKDTSGSAVAKPSKTEQNLFEEDDEFEEFPAEGKWADVLKVEGCALFRSKVLSICAIKTRLGRER